MNKYVAEPICLLDHCLLLLLFSNRIQYFPGVGPMHQRLWVHSQANG